MFDGASLFNLGRGQYGKHTFNIILDQWFRLKKTGEYDQKIPQSHTAD